MKKYFHIGIALVGIAALGGYAYHVQRSSNFGFTATTSANPSSNQTNNSENKPGSGFGSEKGGNQKGGVGMSVAVEVTKPELMALQSDVTAVGSVRSNEAVILRPEVSGRIVAINFKEGQPVNSGQVLIQLDASVNQAEVEQIRAEYQLSLNNLKRTEELAQQKFVSELARDQAASNTKIAEAKLKLAETHLAKMSIRAPFNGIAGLRSVSIGDYVRDGADLVNIEDISSMKIDFRLPERYQTKIKKGQKLEVTTDALPNASMTALVDAIDPRLDVDGRAVFIRAKAQNSNGALRSGMFAKIRLILDERANALMIPEEAIVPEGDDFFVHRVENGKAQKTKVLIGIRRAGKVEIVQGLTIDQLIVVAGHGKFQHDGTAVRIVESGKAVLDQKSALQKSGSDTEV